MELTITANAEVTATLGYQNVAGFGCGTVDAQVNLPEPDQTEVLVPAVVAFTASAPALTTEESKLSSVPPRTTSSAPLLDLASQEMPAQRMKRKLILDNDDTFFVAEPALVQDPTAKAETLPPNVEPIDEIATLESDPSGAVQSTDAKPATKKRQTAFPVSPLSLSATTIAAAAVTAFGVVHNAIVEDPAAISDLALQDGGKIQELLLAFHIAHNQGRTSKYKIGRILFELQEERAKPGSKGATFVRDLEVLSNHYCFSVSTAYRRIEFYKACVEERDVVEEVGLSHFDKDWGFFGIEHDELADELQKVADVKVADEVETIRKEQEKIAHAKKLKNTARSSAKLVLVGLTKPETKQALKAFNALKERLGEKETSRFVLRILLQESDFMISAGECAPQLEAGDE